MDNSVDPRTARSIAQTVGAVLLRLLGARAVPGAGAPFWIWLRQDRMIVSVDPLAVKNIDQVLAPRFAHHLATALHGRRVVATNSRGVYFQISYWPAPQQAELKSLPLDLDAQPGPVHVPIGETRKGPLWLPVDELDSVLVGGSRGMGKTYLLHAWIQALVHGDHARLFLWDGKDGAEFARYEAEDGVLHFKELSRVLDEILAETARRRRILTEAGAPSVAVYNRSGRPTGRPPLPPLVLVIDEAAFIPPDCQETVKDLVAKGRAWGVYPILGTQRPGVAEVQALVKTNLSTRIAFPVPANQDSRVILDRVGAEKLKKIPGRLLIVLGAKLVEAQAYRVDLPLLESGRPTGADLELARWSIERAGGRLSIPLLKDRGFSEWNARKLLDDWTARGWLKWGASNDRYLAPVLSQAAQANSSQLKPTQAGPDLAQAGLKPAPTLGG